MGFYSRVIFPKIVDLTLGRPGIEKLRRRLLANVEGKTLEVGFGTGLNVPHYPGSVTSLTAIDNSEGLTAFAKRRIADAPFPVEFVTMSGESLPFADGTFDSVVFTFTLCSIADVEGALREAHRVLKTGGRLFLLEHGRSPSKWISRIQDILNPTQKFLAEGCHLNRDMKALIADSRFQKSRIQTYYFEEFPKIMGFFYQGYAEK